MAEVNTTPEQATAEPNAASNNAPAEPVTENQTASASSTEKADENHSEKTDEPKAEPEKVAKPAEPEEAEKSSAEQTKTDDNDSEKKIAILEGKVHALTVGVAADCIDDVLALAQAKVSDEVTLEQAIDNVIDKYPNFKGKDKEIITTSVPTANDEQLAAEQEQAKKIMGIK